MNKSKKGRPNNETKKTRKNKKYLEELEEPEEVEEQELLIDDLSESESDVSDDYSDSNEDDDEDEYIYQSQRSRHKEPSISKELNKMIDDTIKDIKEGDIVVPAIGLGLVSIIGYALYKGSKM